jgi:hypothetical protein
MADASQNIQVGGLGLPGKTREFPVKGATTIYEGVRVAQVTASGFLVPVGTVGSGKCIGVATHKVDNSAGADGAIRCLVEYDREYACKNGGGADAFSEATPVGTVAYAVDNQTAGDNDGGATRSILGVFKGMTARGPAIYIG